MRTAPMLFIAVALATTACSDLGLPEQGFLTRAVMSNPNSDHYPTAPQVVSAQRPGAGAASAREDCSAVARQRASDVAAQGFDEETQKAVFDGTYADCAKWQARR